MTRMDVREKLVELLGNIYLPIMAGPDVIGEYRIPHKLKKEIADHLIANGVTVQEWVSVDDRMPDACGFPCLLCGENKFGQIRVFEGFTGYMKCGKSEWHSNQKDIDIDVWTITHWMPLPEPPEEVLKGGEG